MPRAGEKEVLTRLINMLQKIPRYPSRVDAKSLYHQLNDMGFEISKRSVERDLHVLLDIPILSLTYDDERPRGWSWSQDAIVWEVPGMNPQVALAFKLVELYLSDKMPRNIFGSMKPHFLKADTVLNRGHNNNYKDWLNKIAIIPNSICRKPPEISEDVFSVIYNALMTNRRFEATYQAREGEEFKVYPISPLGIVFKDSVIYLVGSAKDYDNVAQWALHRFIDAEPLDVPVKTRKKFNLEKYIEEGSFSYVKSKKTLRLKVQTDAYTIKHLEEMPIADDQKIVDKKDGSFVLTAGVADTDQLRHWLRGYGSQIKVLGPKSLVEEFVAEVEKISEYYL